MNFKEFNESENKSVNFDDNIKWIGEKRFNNIIEYLNEFEDYNGEAELKVTDEELNYDDYTKKLLDGLLGWTFKRNQNGIHNHDGQMVDYEIQVFDDKGDEVANFHTDMCLTVGWNIRFNKKIK